MKSRELTKKVMIAALIASMMLTSTSCSKSTPEPEAIPATPPPVSMQVTQEFSTSIGDKYKYANVATEEDYQEAIKGLVPVEGTVLSVSGHQIYQDEVTGAKFIISGVAKIPWVDIDLWELYTENEGKYVIVVKDEELLATTLACHKIHKDVLSGTAISGSDIPINTNLILNNRAFNVENLIDKDMLAQDEEVFVAINKLLAVVGVEGSDMTYNRSAEQYYGIPTSVIPGIAVEVDIPSELNKYELVFDEANGDVYYACNANTVLGSYFVHEEYLKKMLGWDVKYYKEHDLLVVLTDDMYTEDVLFSGVLSDALTEVPAEEFEKWSSVAGSADADKVISNAQEKEEERLNTPQEEDKDQVIAVPPVKEPNTGIPEGGNVITDDGKIDNKPADKPVSTKPLPGSETGKAPGATVVDKANGLQPGQAIDPRGNYIHPDKIYDGCSINIDGVHYMMAMGKLVPRGTGGTTGQGTDLGGPSGGDWTKGE